MFDWLSIWQPTLQPCVSDVISLLSNWGYQRDIFKQNKDLQTQLNKFEHKLLITYTAELQVFISVNNDDIAKF